MKAAYMYGYRKASPNETGFLKASGEGYSVVPDREDATPFADKVDQWLDFFKGEDELSGWRFHAVYYNLEEQG